MFTTPSNVDGFSRYFAEFFDENNIIGVVTGFLSFFSWGRPIIKTDAEVADIDIIRGNEKTAKFIIRGTVGEYLNNNGIAKGNYSSISRKSPLSAETMPISAVDISDRMAGENPYAMKSRLERMRDMSIDGYHRMLERTIRLHELAAASSILEGVQPAILGTTDPNYQLDFLRDPDLIVTYAAGDRWDVDTNDPIADIDSKITLLIQKGKVAGQSMGGNYVMVMGEDTIAGFFANPFVQTAGNSRRIVTVEKNPEMRAPAELSRAIMGGMTYVGKVATNMGRTVHILSYSAYYDTDAGVSTPYMPTDQFVMMPIKVRTDRYFGPPDTLPMTSLDMQYLRETFGITPRTQIPPMKLNAAPGVIDPSFFYTDAYPGGSRKNAILRVQSAPIYATTQTDAFITGKTVVG